MSGRTVLAATAVLTLFACAYEAAVRWHNQPTVTVLTKAAASHSRAVVDTLATPTLPAASVSTAAPADDTPHQGPVITGPRDPRPVFERRGLARRVLRRYVGTVGGQPTTALLDWQNPSEPQGRFYLHRGGLEYHLTQLDPPARRPRRDQLLNVREQTYLDDDAGEWHLRSQPGATLTGTWRGGPTGRPQTIVMREVYDGAVRLDVQTWRVRGHYTITTSKGDVYNSVPEVQWEFMHLANPASVPPALRPLLSPSSARRRRLLLEKGSSDCTISNELTVRLNDFGLLSYTYYWMIGVIGGSGDTEYRTALFDLRAGRWLDPRSQFRLGYEPGLGRLLAQHLLRDSTYFSPDQAHDWRQQLNKLRPLERDTLHAATRWVQKVLSQHTDAPVLTFTGAGLELEFYTNSFISWATLPEHITVFLPYRELRPLVRPGTPLARMLQARSIW